MPLIVLLKGILIGIIASVPLGPIGVLCVQRTLSKGRISGFFSGLGAATADTVLALVAVLGLTFIINFVEEQQFLIRTAGIVFLIFLGFRIFYANPVVQMRKNRFKKNNLIEDFLSVFVITITNPIAIFLFIAAFAGLGLLPEGSTPFASALLLSGILLGASLYWFFLSSIVNLFKEKFRLKGLWWLNKIAGAIIVFSGVVAFVALLLTSGFNPG